MEKKLKIIHFHHFDSDPRFPPFLLYVRWKSGVTFVRKCFRDVWNAGETGVNILSYKDQAERTRIFRFSGGKQRLTVQFSRNASVHMVPPYFISRNLSLEDKTF